jgi:hypothetical protein
MFFNSASFFGFASCSSLLSSLCSFFLPDIFLDSNLFIPFNCSFSSSKEKIFFFNSFISVHSLSSFRERKALFLFLFSNSSLANSKRYLVTLHSHSLISIFHELISDETYCNISLFLCQFFQIRSSGSGNFIAQEWGSGIFLN